MTPRPRPRLLLVEDEPGLVVTLTDRLEAEGYAIQSVEDGETALERLDSEAFDLLLLDVMLPGMSGFDVCRDLRQRRHGIPVLMLTARGQVTDRVVGLKLGADDYLTKPFEMIELLARIEALLRRAGDVATTTAGRRLFGPLEVDFGRAEVFKDGTTVELSAMEYKLLLYFLEHRGQLLTREQLLRDVWEHDELLFTRTVDVHVSWLRQKLEPLPSKPIHLLTVHGRGYKFVV